MTSGLLVTIGWLRNLPIYQEPAHIPAPTRRSHPNPTPQPQPHRQPRSPRHHDAVTPEEPHCAARRPVISPVQPGGTRREVPGSDALPRSERFRGTIAWQESNGRVQAYETRRCGTRVIWLKLDCLNLNLQEAQLLRPPERRLKPVPRPALTWCGGWESAGINRHEGGDGRALRRRASDPRRPRVMRRRPVRAWRSVDRGTCRPGYRAAKSESGVLTLSNRWKATLLPAFSRAGGGPCAVKEPWHARNLHAREPGEPVSARPPDQRVGRPGDAKAVSLG